MPSSSELGKVLVDGKEIDSQDVDQEAIKDKKSFGFLVEVPIQGQKTVEIRYQLGEKVGLNNATRYVLLVQKQPGISDKNFDFWLSVPSGISLIDPKPSAKVSQSVDEKSSQTKNSLYFDPEFKEDLIFEAGIVKWNFLLSF